jgi:DNA-binding Lrp family transcriptional regulator
VVNDSGPPSARTREDRPDSHGFAFLTNHGKALLLVAHDPQIRIRDIAALLGITERATQSIVSDLDKAGYIERERVGRRNRYSVSTHLPLGLPTQRDADIQSLLAVLHGVTSEAL